VFYCHSQEVGGAELYLERLMLHLAGEMRAQRVPRATLELVCRPDSLLDGLCTRLAAGSVRVHRLGLRRPLDYWRLRRILRGAALVHLNLAFPFGKYQALGALAGRLCGGYLISVHQLALDIDAMSYGRLYRSGWSILFPLYARLCHHHIVVSHIGKRLLVSRYGLPSEKMTVIYNGADLQTFRPLSAETRAAVKASIGNELTRTSWPENTQLICSVGRLNPQKGFETLIEAAVDVVAAHPAARFVIVGEGELRQSLATLIDAEGLSQHVFLAGHQAQSKLAQWLSASDMFVLPSRYEGFPSALVEAMASGCAVIAAAVDGVREAVTDQQTGITVPAAQPEALGRAITKLLDQPDLRNAIAARGQAEAVERFSLRTTLQQTAQLYIGLVTRSRKRNQPPAVSA
jgi:glycosyltransferase involved in cell wall biosynthesis